jgi:hypothetical protein
MHSLEIVFLGLSGHLASNAPGHYETFHKGMLQGFQELLGESNAFFLGSQKSKGQECWFDPLVPTSITSTIPWLPKNFLNFLGDYQADSKKVRILYIYEGNLATLFLLGRVARRSKDVFVFFNLFNSFKYAKILNSRPRCLLFKAIFLLVTRGLDDKIKLVADTERFGILLKSKLGKSFTGFPMYSALSPELIFTPPGERRTTLINLRGYRSENLFKEAFASFPELHDQEIVLHGLINKDIANHLSQFSNIRISNNQLDEAAYFTEYNKYNRTAFIYDPEFFTMQSSGRLADAIVAKTILVVPKGTALEDVLHENGNGSSFDFNDAASLAHALLAEPEIARRLDDLPTKDWAANTILQTMENLISEGKKEKKLHRTESLVVDEIIWIALGCLRVFSHLYNRIKATLGLKN